MWHRWLIQVLQNILKTLWGLLVDRCGMTGFKSHTNVSTQKKRLVRGRISDIRRGEVCGACDAWQGPGHVDKIQTNKCCTDCTSTARQPNHTTNNWQLWKTRVTALSKGQDCNQTYFFHGNVKCVKYKLFSYSTNVQFQMDSSVLSPELFPF